MNKSNLALLLALVLLAAATLFIWKNWDQVDQEADQEQPPVAVVNSFDECEAAGYGISDSYPRQCQTPDGRTFVEDIGNELDKTDLIRIATPRPGDTVASPLTISGQARGFWFFEASFPIIIYDAQGTELGRTVASAQSDWMTDQFVPFSATLNFQTPPSGSGKLVLMKDNPSGLKENDDSLVVPIKFGSSNQTQQISLFAYDADKDKDAAGNVKCSADGLVEVKRKVALGPSAISDTIKLLLQGELTTEEKGKGLSTQFPLPGVSLESAMLDGSGLLTISLSDPQNQTSGGSCRVNVMRSQLEMTAKQFPGVKEVKFSPDTLFQP